MYYMYPMKFALWWIIITGFQVLFGVCVCVLGTASFSDQYITVYLVNMHIA